jgi:hypothetical protein
MMATLQYCEVKYHTSVVAVVWHLTVPEYAQRSSGTADGSYQTLAGRTASHLR